MSAISHGDIEFFKIKRQKINFEISLNKDNFQNVSARWIITDMTHPQVDNLHSPEKVNNPFIKRDLISTAISLAHSATESDIPLLIHSDFPGLSAADSNLCRVTASGAKICSQQIFQLPEYCHEVTPVDLNNKSDTQSTTVLVKLVMAQKNYSVIFNLELFFFPLIKQLILGHILNSLEKKTIQ